MISAVFDATTLLQAAVNRKGPAGACLALVEQGHVKLFVSEVTFNEIDDVLHRPSIRKAFRRLSDESVQEFLEHLVDKSHRIDKVPQVYQFRRDPDDEPYLNLAIATQSSFLVSRDNDLLDLKNDETFRSTYPSLTITDPVAFLNHVRAQIARDLGYE